MSAHPRQHLMSVDPPDLDTVCRMWSHSLDGKPVGADDDLFFDLDGSSLMAVAILARVAADTGLPLELRDLYLAPTPRELTKHLIELASRLRQLRRPDGAWNAPSFAAALAELGAAAAETLLPPDAVVIDPRGGTRALGPDRSAVLRRARGNGTCTVLAGHPPRLRRPDGILELHAAREPDALVIRLVESAAPGQE